MRKFTAKQREARNLYNKEYLRQWYEKHPEKAGKYNAKRAEKRAANPEPYRIAMREKYASDEDHREAAKLRAKARKHTPEAYAYRERADVRARAAQLQREARQKDPLRFLIFSARSRAKANGVPFDIKAEDLIVPTECPLLGIPIAFSPGRVKETSLSLDRIDNAKGYTKGNVWVISHRANRIKQDASLDELRMIVRGLEGRLCR